MGHYLRFGGRSRVETAGNEAASHCLRRLGGELDAFGGLRVGYSRFPCSITASAMVRS